MRSIVTSQHFKHLLNQLGHKKNPNGDFVHTDRKAKMAEWSVEPITRDILIATSPDKSLHLEIPIAFSPDEFITLQAPDSYSNTRQPFAKQHASDKQSYLYNLQTKLNKLRLKEGETPPIARIDVGIQDRILRQAATALRAKYEASRYTTMKPNHFSEKAASTKPFTP